MEINLKMEAYKKGVYLASIQRYAARMQSEVYPALTKVVDKFVEIDKAQRRADSALLKIPDNLSVIEDLLDDTQAEVDWLLPQWKRPDDSEWERDWDRFIEDFS